MKCETVIANLDAIRAAALPERQLAGCRSHLARCPDCADALRGAEAMDLLKIPEPPAPPPDLFPRIAERVAAVPVRRKQSHFWLGTGFGGAIAASLFAAAIALGWFGPPAENPAGRGIPEFTIAIGEPRSLDLAIEVDQALADADISIMLSDGVELAGYGSIRELSWKTDLNAGVNRLTLPVVGLTPAGGQLVVRLRHPQTDKVFVVNLSTEA